MEKIELKFEMRNLFNSKQITQKTQTDENTSFWSHNDLVIGDTITYYIMWEENIKEM